MSGKTWVLLVAGSKGWDNYRHQANVCCAYQLIRKQGIPEKQIVVMTYDDIANNPENPLPGDIRSVVDQTNVYKSVPHDYTGDKVNAKTFLAVLQGDDTAEKKIIRSEENDNIFIYMSGVGSEGKFDFPEESLTATDLIKTINIMNAGKKYSKMVIYMDSDFSASMFTSLSGLINVYAVASCDSSNPNIPYPYDSERSTCLSDEFSAAWLKFVSAADDRTATFKKQYDYIKKKDKSKPCEFGDKKFENLLISEFLNK